MVTMADVARRAGVSITTVSHVLNRTRHVSPETERAVRAALEQTGYVSDGIARSLRTGTTQTIGLAMSAISNPYFAEVVLAVEREAAAAGYSLLLADTHDEPATESRAVADILARRVDAMLLAPSADPGPVLAAIRRRGLPVVLMDRFRPEPLDQVGVENARSTARLVEHLADLGHRRIGMISGRVGLSTTDERLQGYRLGLDGAGLPYDGELVVAGDSLEAGAREAVGRLLSSRRPPTALVAGNNQMTIGALRALRQRGLAVPGDLALVAFDDFPWADLFTPRLTVMAQPTADLGRAAVALLLQRLGGLGGEPRSMRLDPVFEHRNSCGCS